ncbi:MAG: YvcK family protein [Synechococcus sp. SB0668_bin_15]|nr:YvcK family protein [Synechococcus sp. SB0668_bin_15]MYC49729.1 YvcK family protein [Synechococcus sp. SB0662_bin_14]
MANASVAASPGLNIGSTSQGTPGTRIVTLGAVILAQSTQQQASGPQGQRGRGSGPSRTGRQPEPRRRPLSLGRSCKALQWLSPGLLIKRWVLTSALGLLLLLLGSAIWANLKPVYWTLEAVEHTLAGITRLLPYQLTGPLVLLSGLVLILLGQSRTFRSIKQALAPEQDQSLVDALLAQRRLKRGPSIVAIGGGTGLATLLSGLKRYSSSITAIVAVTDDGGSSGRLRRDLGIQPPGDIRNCLTALAKEEQLLTQLFHYRFTSGEGLEGHSLGNLFLSALTNITGNLESAVAASSRVLNIQGQVLPATNADVHLWAQLEDGRLVEGESRISGAGGRIHWVGCQPEAPPALPSALEAIRQADLILLGPGSLYTSLLPNLLVPQIVKEISRSSAAKLYICNLMTQPGETDGLDVWGHVAAIGRHLRRQGVTSWLFPDVLAHSGHMDRHLVERYRSAGSEPVTCPVDKLKAEGLRPHLAMMHDRVESLNEEAVSKSLLRHDPWRLARAVMRFYRHHQRRQQPREIDVTPSCG